MNIRTQVVGRQRHRRSRMGMGVGSADAVDAPAAMPVKRRPHRLAATQLEEPQRRSMRAPSSRATDSPKEVGHAHHPRGLIPSSVKRAAAGREWSLSARERHPALLHQSLRTNHTITRVVLRAALFVVRILERSAALLAFGHRPHDDHKNSAFTSTPRTARLLLLLANFGKEGSREPIVGKYSQEMLAEMIGTTRSRVSFFMNKFRKLGFIEYNGKLEVHKSLLNMVLHEKPEIKTRDEAISAE